MTSKLRFALSKVSFQAVPRQKSGRECCSSNRWGSGQNGLRLFLSGQVAVKFGQGTKIFVFMKPS